MDARLGLRYERASAGEEMEVGHCHPTEPGGCLGGRVYDKCWVLGLYDL